MLVVDNASGDVLAYVGDSGALSSARHVDGIRAHRQAGSTLKPFLYGLALQRRLLTPASLIEDTPVEIAVAGGLYQPHDYDEQFRGLVSVRTALAGSLNVPAVRTLGLVGGESFVHQLRLLGFRVAQARRLLRSVPGVGLRRGQPVGAGRRLSGARQRWRLDAAPPDAGRRRRGRRAPVHGGRRLADLDILSDRDAPQHHLRPREPARDPFLDAR